MCTDDTFRKEAEARAALALSRRDFNLAALSAAAIALLPSCGGARGSKATASTAPATLVRSKVDIKTADGVADAYFVHPATGAHPAVVVWPDFMSLRPTYEQLADKLAGSGYAVLVVNMYYRSARSPVVEKVDFDDKELMAKIGGLAKALTAAMVQSDARACVAFLDGQPAVDQKRKLGVMGYCMGGGIAFDSAAAVPERFGAVVSFHGNISDGTPESPHLLIPQIKAQALVAIAADDASEDPAEQTVVRDAFKASGVAAEVEVYEGTHHGWCTPDMVSRYNAEQAQRAWSRMLALYERALV